MSLEQWLSAQNICERFTTWFDPQFEHSYWLQLHKKWSKSNAQDERWKNLPQLLYIRIKDNWCFVRLIRPKIAKMWVLTFWKVFGSKKYLKQYESILLWLLLFFRLSINESINKLRKTSEIDPFLSRFNIWCLLSVFEGDKMFCSQIYFLFFND